MENLMKNFFQRLFRNVDASKHEKLLMVLLPIVTLVLVVSILAPTVIMLSQSESGPAPVRSAAPAPASAVPAVSAEPVFAAAPSAAPIVTPAPTATAPPQFDDVVSVLDARGRQLYDYYFDLGPNGYLLYADTGIESDVYPNDTDGDGVPDQGLRWVEEPAEEGEEPDGSYLIVDLYNADNSPNRTYAIAAVPVMSTVTVSPGWQTIDGKTYYYGNTGERYTGLHNIGGKLYFFNEFGVCADAIGIDVSFYNKNINWPSVKAAGIDFAIIRVGGRGWESGLMYDDTCFQQNIESAMLAGLKVGVYFYSTANDPAEAVQEALFVLDRLHGAKLSMPIYFDTEQSGDFPYGRADRLYKCERTDIIDAFCETVIAAGYRAGVYSGQNFFQYNLDYTSSSKYDIWLASYTKYNRLPNFREAYDMWQFTDRGVVPGIPGVVDMNAIFE